MKEKISVFMVLAAAALWGCIGIFVRHLNEFGLDAMQITASKCLVNGGMMLLLLLVTDREKLKIQKRDAGWFLANGILSIYVFNTAYHAAISLIPMSTAVVLLYTAPAFVMLLSVVFFGERFTWMKGLCLVLCVGGSALVSGLGTAAGGLSGPGLLLGLVSGIGYALYSIFSGVIVRKYHPFTNVCYTFLIAGTAAALSCDMGEALGIASGSGEAMCWMLLNGILTSFIPYISYTTALRYMNPSKAAILATLEPVVATLAGILLYGESMTFMSGVGVFMVFVALVLSNLPPRTA
ncbi:MAG: EamA family transporter [Clostridiales bacterium]|nr:EamA family transporter [Clostridiales bacterium]